MSLRDLIRTETKISEFIQSLLWFHKVVVKGGKKKSNFLMDLVGAVNATNVIGLHWCHVWTLVQLFSCLSQFTQKQSEKRKSVGCLKDRTANDKKIAMNNTDHPKYPPKIILERDPKWRVILYMLRLSKPAIFPRPCSYLTALNVKPTTCICNKERFLLLQIYD